MVWATGSVFEEVGGGIWERGAGLTLSDSLQASRADVGSRLG